ncbi:hypothetical protein PCCS19_57640 [Paenibacillus sp. CCS19]|nr:hypothetical protein PCCS19_57640 [Paenibacillus cellulosilyticus]
MEATDKGSLADIQGWAKNTGHHYLGTVHEGEVLKHYIRKASAGEAQPERKFPRIVSNEDLEQVLASAGKATILDVREPAEYAFSHIPGAKTIPLGELENRMGELSQEEDIYVVCRTGSRSDLACQLLESKGFARVRNVEPGMSGWAGALEREA